MLDSTAEKMHVSQFTNAEIDARYPREAWLQLLLKKGITIKNFGEYASYLSKRHTLALLKDSPSLRKTGILGIPPTDEWTTYKTAYINRLVNDHTQIRQTAERVERAKAERDSRKSELNRQKHGLKALRGMRSALKHGLNAPSNAPNKQKHEQSVLSNAPNRQKPGLNALKCIVKISEIIISCLNRLRQNLRHPRKDRNTLKQGSHCRMSRSE